MDAGSFLHNHLTLRLGGRLLDLQKPQVMGILNLTQDSFFDGGQYLGLDAAKDQAERMIAEGAQLLDLGAYSSRPGAADVPANEEILRLKPMVEWLAAQHPQIGISVDTFRAQVAEQAINAGGHIINDISGGGLDPAMFETVGRLQVPYVLMHMRGNPQNMQQLTQYDDLFGEIAQYFAERIAQLRSCGVKDIILDPGFGFAKTTEQNFALLDQLDGFEFLGWPILGGISRKSMIYKTLGITPQEALNGTTVLNTLLLQKGVSILRVHDVKEAVETVRLFDALQKTRGK